MDLIFSSTPTAHIPPPASHRGISKMTGKSTRRNDLGEEMSEEAGLELLTTSFRKEFERPPFTTRAKKFVREQYSPQALIPSMQWIPKYVKGGWRENLYGDVCAGLTVGAFLVPQGMSYALIADLPPTYGLYTASFPVIIYALLGTSNQLAVGPVAIISLLIGNGVGAIVPHQNVDGTPNQEFIKLCITVSFFVGLLNLAMGLLKMGFLTTFLSHPVVSGFTSAAAIIIAIRQAKHILGFSLLDSENTFAVIFDLLKRLGETHVISLLMGLGVMAFLYTIASFPRLKKIPAATVVLTLGILISWAANLEEKGVKVAGQIPKGVPTPACPDIPHGPKFSKALILSVVITLLGYMESVAVGLTYAAKNGYQIRPDQELLAFGAANVVGAFFSAYPVAGGFGRSAVNANAGAKTPLAGLISGSLMLVVLAGLTSLFTHLPTPVLGAIVIMAVTKLVDVAEPQRLRRTEAWGDLAAFATTFLATLVVGVELGLGVGVGCSLLVILLQLSRPHTAVLGRVPHSGAFHDLSVIASALPIPGTLVVRIDADLWFATARPLKDAVLAHVYSYPGCCSRAPETGEKWRETGGEREREVEDDMEACRERERGAGGGRNGGVGQGRRERLRVVVLDLSGVNLMDASALHELHALLTAIRAVPSVREVAIAGAKRHVRRQILRELQITAAQMRGRELRERGQRELYQIFRKYDTEGQGAISEADAVLAVAEALGHHPEGNVHADGEAQSQQSTVSAGSQEDGGGGVRDEGAGVEERGGGGAEVVCEKVMVKVRAEMMPEKEGEESCTAKEEGLEAGVGWDAFVARVEEGEQEQDGGGGVVKLFSNVQQAVECPALVRAAGGAGAGAVGTQKTAEG